MTRALTRDPEELRDASAYGVSRLSPMPVARLNAEADVVRAAHGLSPSAVPAPLDTLALGGTCNKVTDAAARGSLNAKEILTKIAKRAAASKRDPTHSAPRLPRPVPPWRYPATKEKKT